jgi:tetratricopeptide (TPR) repeat protein
MSQPSQSSQQQMLVFVSHAHEDDVFCRVVVSGLRGAGANVWYDEHNMGSGQLLDTIERELRARPVFVLILSPAALHSQWVRDESKWAYAKVKRDPSRIILPVVAAVLPDEDDIWLFLQDFRRIEAPGLQPYPAAEAVRRLLHALELTPAGEAPAPPAPPQPSESAEDLLARGKALAAQQKYAEAVPLFERATQLAPRSFDAWANLGRAYNETGRHGPDVDAYDHALALDSQQNWVWNNKGNALRDLKRPEEALTAYERAITLDPTFAIAWSGKGSALYDLKRYEEALAAYERAITLDPTNAVAWSGKGSALNNLKRYEEALAAYERALTLGETALRWNNKAYPLRALGRIAGAEAAERRAKELGG